MGHGTHTDSRILYGDWSSIEITNPVSGFAPAGGCESLFGFAIRNWKPVGSVTCVQMYCFTVLPFYAFLLLSYLHMHLSAACSLALLHMERLKPLPPQSRYDFSTVEYVSVRDAWIHHPPTTSTKQPFGS